MPRTPSRFWLTALLIAWAVDFLFFQKPIGISFLIWVGLTLTGLWVVARSEGVRSAWPSYVLGGVLLLLALIPFLRREPFSIAIAVLLSVLGLILLAATFRNGHWLFYRTWDILSTGVVAIFYAIVRPFDLRKAEIEPEQGSSVPAPGSRQTRREIYAVLRGLLLALPIVMLLGALLASADQVFADRMRNLWVLFRIERLPEYTFRLVYILVLAFGFTGALLHAVLPKNQAKRPDQAQGVVKPFLGWTETTIVLVSVNALFLFFVILQFQYLFGGQANITSLGYTYSEYARRGFNELVWVAVLSLLIYLTFGTVSRRETVNRGRAFSLLRVVLLTLVLVILASALQRLVLYEQAYGFTRLRTYTFILIPWLAVLLITTNILEFIGRSHRFGLVLLLVILGFGMTFGALNLDGFIVRKNVERALAGEEFDSFYLSTLSSDAVPALFDFYQRPGVPSWLQDALGMELACRAAVTLNEAPQPWPSYTLSDARARRILAANGSAWEKYPVETDSYNRLKVSVGERTRLCFREGWLD